MILIIVMIIVKMSNSYMKLKIKNFVMILVKKIILFLKKIIRNIVMRIVMNMNI